MTTVCTDGKTMAGDGRGVTLDRVTNEAMEKVIRLSDGRIYGFSGTTEDGLSFRQWLEDGGKPPKVSDTMQAMVLSADGIRYYAGGTDQGLWDAPASIGSGGDYALGAMLAGKTPEEAVAIAARVEINTGGKITALSL